MPTYQVKLIYKYTETVEVEAETERQALEIAPSYSNEPEYDCLYDVITINTTSDKG